MAFTDRGFYTLHDIDKLYDDVVQAQRVVLGTFKNDKSGIGDMFRFKLSGADNNTQAANQALYDFVPVKNIAIDAQHITVPTNTITSGGIITATFPTNRFNSIPVVNVLMQSNSHNYIPVVVDISTTSTQITFKPSSGSLVLSGSITPVHLLHILSFGKGA